MTGRVRGVIGVAAGLVAAAAIVFGLLQAGSPGAARDRRLDERRIDDLRGLARAVDLHWTRNGQLPPSVSGLPTATDEPLATTDPVSGREYDYLVLEERKFELCAEFATAQTATGDRAFWSHPEGRHCFGIDVEMVAREPVVPVAPRATAPPTGR
ncbi:MAG: hypothetical protein QF681_03495 [Vicinamibacterales bacterium]|nr:hypothetical protein [Vicinamibacterales bacterium]